MRDIDICKFLRKSKAEDFYLGCNMYMGYVAGLPIISAVGNKLCLKVPYLKYKVTGEVDKTLVYPVKYVLTYSLPDLKPVGFEDLEYNKTFRKVEFNRPIGYFRHDAIKALSKKEYADKKAELFSMYNELAASLIENKPYSRINEFKKLLNIIIEPSVKPIYKALDNTFYKNYLS